MNTQPQRDLELINDTGGEKKRNHPHYKEMYESALRELQLQRRVNRLHTVFTVLGWIGFMISVSLLIVERV